MATPSIETARGWLGRVMVDRDSNKIGKVVDIYLDNETGRPEWAVVRTGLFGLRSSFVPLAEARAVGDELQVPRRLARHWPNRLARPTCRTRRAGGGDRGPRPQVGQQRDRGLADTGIDAEPGASASGSGSSEPDREPPDTSILESELGRGDARDGLSATGGGEPVEAAGQDRLPVGKG